MPRFSPLKRGMTWKWMWKTVCPAGGAVELGDLHAVRLHLLDQGAGQALDHGHDLDQVLRLDLEQVARLGVLGNHQGMPVGLREQIEEGEHVLVFVDLSRELRRE